MKGKQTNDFYIIINMVTAELITNELFISFIAADVKLRSYNNWLGTYCAVNLNDHIKSLHTHFNKYPYHENL